MVTSDIRMGCGSRGSTGGMFHSIHKTQMDFSTHRCSQATGNTSLAGGFTCFLSFGSWYIHPDHSGLPKRAELQ